MLIFRPTMIFKLLISTAVFHFAHSITLSCDTDVPENHSNISCSCRNPTKNGIEWRRNSQIVTTCSGTKDSCFPPSLKYRSSVSSDEFYLEVSPYSYTDCARYSCKDVSTAEEVSVTTSIADFDQRSITTEEPGANTDGQIMVNTGCVFPTSNITVRWYKIENGTEEDFTAIQSSKRSNCSRTCNTETDEKVESGFTHTEYTGSDYVEVVYKVTVTHKLYIDEVFTWTSSKYRLKAGTTPQPTIAPPSTTTKVQVCEGRNIVIVSMVFGILGALGLLFIVCELLTGCINERKTLLLASEFICIVCEVLSLVLSIVVNMKDCCEESSVPESLKNCEDWILNSAIAFVVIPIVCMVVATDVFFLVYLNVIKLGGNGMLVINKRPMPPIPKYDDDYTMITIGVADKRAGDLRPLEEEPQKKKKKKAVSDDDDDDDDDDE